MAKIGSQESEAGSVQATSVGGRQEWAGIISVVKTPLGFFVLVILVLEALFGVLVYTSNVDKAVQSGLLITTFALILILILLVAYLAVYKPGSLPGTNTTTILPTSKTARSSSTVKTIQKGEILCACSPQWKGLAFPEDVKAIRESFPKVQVEYQLNSEKLVDLLTQKNFSIIHIAGYVDRNGGDMIFSEINDGKPVSSADGINVNGFSTLVKNANVSLVVLATCDSLLLAVHLARYTNVISTNDWVEGEKIAKWSKTFYRLLSQGKTLSKAYEVATNSMDVRMYLIIKSDFSLRA
jgi:hypothetical protein